MVYLTVFAVAFILVLGLTPLAARLGLRLGLVDQPGGRRRHQGIIPRTGGIAIFVAFAATVLLTLLLAGNLLATTRMRCAACLPCWPAAYSAS